MKSYTIGQISRAVGLPTKTIRFYEAAGVISRPKRATNGYRLYPETAADELRMLKYARDLGLPLAEIKKLMRGCENGNCDHSKTYVEASIDDYLTRLTGKIAEMETLKAKLIKLRATLATSSTGCGDGPFCCNILHQLVEFTSTGKDGDTHGTR